MSLSQENVSTATLDLLALTLFDLGLSSLCLGAVVRPKLAVNVLGRIAVLLT